MDYELKDIWQCKNCGHKIDGSDPQGTRAAMLNHLNINPTHQFECVIIAVEAGTEVPGAEIPEEPT